MTGEHARTHDGKLMCNACGSHATRGPRKVELRQNGLALCLPCWQREQSDGLGADERGVPCEGCEKRSPDVRSDGGNGAWLCDPCRSEAVDK